MSDDTRNTGQSGRQDTVEDGSAVALEAAREAADRQSAKKVDTFTALTLLIGIALLLFSVFFQMRKAGFEILTFAAGLGLIHPASGEALSWSAPPPADFQQLLQVLRDE